MFIRLEGYTNLSRSKAFTLLELVATLSIISILAVVVLPRFVGTGTFAEHAVRDEIAALFRFAQQRAMYDHSGMRCYGVAIDANGASVRVNNALLSPEYAVNFNAQYEDISATPLQVYFDGMGDVRSFNCSGARLSSAQLITVVGSKTLTLNLYPSGYVRSN